MEEMKKKLLEEAGVDIEDALARFMNNETLMLKMLLRFTEDNNFFRLKQAMEEQNISQAFEAAHALKGLTGNLSLKELYQKISIMTEDLRRGDLTAAAAAMPELENLFHHATENLLALD